MFKIKYLDIYDRNIVRNASGSYQKGGLNARMAQLALKIPAIRNRRKPYSKPVNAPKKSAAWRSAYCEPDSPCIAIGEPHGALAAAPTLLTRRVRI